MIKKSTARKVRDYLECVRANLRKINQGHGWSATEWARIYGISPGRMNAVVSLGYFERTGKNGHYNTYKCNVKHFTLAMARQVIRKEYDRKAKASNAPRTLGELRGISITPLSDLLAKQMRELNDKMKESAVDWLKRHEYKGVIYKGTEIIAL